jgi:tetratricopeptide (TPR) repeat protein
MTIWSGEIKELEKLYDSFKGHLPDLEKELEQLVRTQDANVVMLYSRRCLEVIVTDLCESELKRPRKSQPLKGIIDKLDHEEKVPPHIITSMLGLNSLSSFGTHPKDFDTEQVKPVLNHLATIIRWYVRYKEVQSIDNSKLEEGETGYTRQDKIKKDLFKPDLKGTKSDKTKSGGRLKFIIISSLLILLLVIFLFAVYQRKTFPVSEKTIALIPLQSEVNDSTLTESGDILLDLIREKLQQIEKLSLIPRISCIQYRNTKKPINEIIDELYANYYIAGSIGHETNKQRVWIELINKNNNNKSWFHKYTLDKNQIIKLSNEIVMDITSDLEFLLTPEEKNRIKMIPTENDEAYQNLMTANSMSNDAWLYYNMGNKLLDSSSLISAIKIYDRAIQRDSLFALAFAKRAIARSWGVYIGQLDSSHIVRCREDIDNALKIDKELPEAQNALGFYFYYCMKNDNEALKHFRLAADYDPENYQPLFYMAVVYRKSGDWEKSQSLMNRVIPLKPREALFLTNIGMSFTFLHKYDSALIYHQKAIDAFPGWLAPYQNMLETYVLKTGNTDSAGIVLDSAIKKTGKRLMNLRALLCIYNGKYNEAFKFAELADHNDFKIYANRYIYLASISSYLNQPLNAKKYYDSALVVLKNDLVKSPENIELHSSAALAYAGLGDRINAIKEVKFALERSANNSTPMSEMKIVLAQVYVMLGDFKNAIGCVEELLTSPSCLSLGLIHLDPVWKKLREQPEFISFQTGFNKKTK